jgi:hypothetical protein
VGIAGRGRHCRWLYCRRARILTAARLAGERSRNTPDIPAMTGLAEPRLACSAAVAAVLLVLPALANIAGAQNNQPSASPAPASQAPTTQAPASATPPLPPQPPPAAFQPGFLHQLKVWWDDSIGFLDDKIKDTRGKADDLGKKTGEATQGAAAATKDAASAAQDAMKSAVEATKNAATAIVKLPGTRVVEVHERCDKAPNGAPDCEAAAAAGCRGKGFAGGRPLDVRTMEKCDTTALRAAETSGQRDCPVETVVSRAVCQ